MGGNTMRVILIAILAFTTLSCSKQEVKQKGLELLDGNVLYQKDWQGKWVYINYWAEWCKPCAEEVPELNAFAKAHPDVLVLGVNFDKPEQSLLLNQSISLHIEYPVIIGDIQTVFPHEMPQGLPTTIVIRPSGEIADTLQGPQTADSLSQILKK